MTVDVNLLNPFISSVGSVFSTMLRVTPKRLKVAITGDSATESILSAIIGISGNLHGVVALRFPPATALNLAGRMLESSFDKLDEQVVDAISELTNMVAGSAKAKFHHEPPLQLGLPTVVEGTSYKLKYPSKSVSLDVPFNSEAGDFVMEFTYIPQ